MPQFSEASKKQLATCHPDLQRLFNEVIKTYDCAVIIGFRNQQEQHKAFVSGKSKLDWPNSNHNKTPSLAADVVPFPIDWDDELRFHHFAGFVLGVAQVLGIKIRWGGDWNRNNIRDQNWFDLPHFELMVEGSTGG